MKDTNLFAKWNRPQGRCDPFVPWNDPVYKNDPFAPWNRPLSNEEDYKKYCEERHIPEQNR